MLQQGPETPKNAAVRVRIVDLSEPRRFLKNAGNVCYEGARSSDVRVVRLALQVLEQESDRARELLRKIA